MVLDILSNWKIWAGSLLQGGSPSPLVYRGLSYTRQMMNKNEINENGLDLGIMDVGWVQVYARAQSGMVEAHGFCWKVAQVS